MAKLVPTHPTEFMGTNRICEDQEVSQDVLKSCGAVFRGYEDKCSNRTCEDKEALTAKLRSVGVRLSWENMRAK